jgi:hypothetical protein
MSDQRDVLQVLAEARPRRLDPETAPPALVLPADARHDRARRRVTPERLVGGLALAAAATAAVVTTAGVATAPLRIPPGSAVATGPDAPGRAVVPVADVLLVAAEQAERAEGAATGRYWVSRLEAGGLEEVGPPGDRYRIRVGTAQQIWVARSAADQSWLVLRSLGARPAGPADTAAWRRDGSPSSWEIGAPTPIGGGDKRRAVAAAEGTASGHPIGTGSDVFALGETNVSQRQLDALPSDPAKLTAALLRFHTGGGGDLPTDRDAWLFAVGSELVLQLPVRPAVRAAAYRMLGGLDGVRALGAVTDLEGRRGQAVAVTRTDPDGSRLEERLIVDPRSGAALAGEVRYLTPPAGRPWLTPDVVFAYRLVTGSGWTTETPPKVRPIPGP